jgi:hypothetical protein
MARSTDKLKSLKATSDASAKRRTTQRLSARPVKTRLTRSGMSPQRLLDAAGSISSKTLDVIEKAIEEGCGRVESHGA